MPRSPKKAQREDEDDLLLDDIPDTEIESTEQEDTRLGLFGMYPDWLQKFATIKWFLFVVCLFPILQGVTVAGLIPVALTSLERRFGFDSRETGLIVAWYDGVIALAALVVTNYGHTAHKPSWLGKGMLSVGIGSLLFAAPNFMIGKYLEDDAGPALDEACVVVRNYVTPDCPVGSISYLLFFLLAQTIISIGSSPLFSLGAAFLDDNTPPDSASTYLAIYMAMSALGPAIGFIFGGLTLNIFVNPTAHTSLTPDSAAWIGAWWIGFVVAGVCSIIFSILLFLFPKNLPNTQWIRDIRLQAKDQQKQQAEAIGADKLSFWVNIKLLVTNKPFIFVNLAQAMMAYFIVGFGSFLPKLLETQFRTTSSTSSMLAGGCTIAGVVVGMLIGGIISKKWTPKQIIRNCCFLTFAASCFIAFLLIHCTPVSLAGLQFPYPNNNNSASALPYNNSISALTEVCNSQCNCKSLTYNPVCGGQFTYFNPCYAGCANKSLDATGNVMYTNCSCVTPNPVDQNVVNGVCNVPCKTLPVFLGLMIIFLILIFITAAPVTTFSLRTVPEHQRSLGLGLSSALYRVVGAIPGPLLIGAILDKDCLLWEQKPGCDSSDHGACWIYDSGQLSWHMFFLIIFVGISVAILCFLSWFYYHPMSDEVATDEAPSQSVNLSGDSPTDDVPLVTPAPVRPTRPANPTSKVSTLKG